MYRRGMLGLIGAVAAWLPAAARAETNPGTRDESRKTHRLAIHVDQNDPDVINMALGNAANAIDYYADRGEEIAIEIVAYGPGLHMMRADTSPVQERLATLRETKPQITYSACNNTRKAMEKREGKEITFLPKVTVVPAGIVRLTELQEQGWSYVRP
jgi:intracellular sulfur oxidation DsrE/DsrF family protein